MTDNLAAPLGEARCPACHHVRDGMGDMCSVEWCRCVCTDEERAETLATLRRFFALPWWRRQWLLWRLWWRAGRDVPHQPDGSASDTKLFDEWAGDIAERLAHVSDEKFLPIIAHALSDAYWQGEAARRAVPPASLSWFDVMYGGPDRTGWPSGTRFVPVQGEDGGTVDAADLKSAASRHAGSTPAPRTISAAPRDRSSAPPPEPLAHQPDPEPDA